MIQREEVAGIQALGPSSAVRSPVKIDHYVPPVTGNKESDQVSRILGGLSQFVDASSEVAFKEAQKQNELNKINGMNTALSGGKLGEEATKAHEIGYDMVTAQNDLMKANESVAQAIQANPMMSDDEMNSIRDSAYGGVLSQYQDKAPEVFKALSIQAQQSQGVLYNMQQKARQQYRQQKGIETLNSLIGQSVDGARSVADGAKLIEGYMAQGKQLGLDEFTTKDQIFQQMKLSASMGDPRLLEFVKATDWGRYTMDVKQGTAAYKQYQKQVQAEIRAAQAQAQAAMAQQNALAYGMGLAEIDRAARGGATDGEIMGMLSNLQKKGMKLSASTVASYLNKGQQVSQSQLKLNENLARWQNDRGNFNLATNPTIDTEDKKKVLGAAEDAIVKMADQQAPEAKGDFVIQNLMELSKQEGMPVPRIQTAFSSLTNLDPNQPMPPAAQTWMKYLLSADDQTLRMNVPNEQDQKLLFSMRDTLMNNQGADAETSLRTALVRGQTVRDNKVPLNTQQTKTLATKSASAVKALQAPDQDAWFFKTSKLPDSQRDYVTQAINAKAKTLYQVTGDPEKAVNMAVKEYKLNNIILSGGITANIGTAQLAAKIPEFAAGKDVTAQDMQMKAVSALDYQVDNLLKSQAKVDGIKYERGDAKVIFSNGGEAYQIMVGGLSVGTYPTRGLKDQFNEDYFNKWSARQEVEQQKSNAYRMMKESKEFSSTINPYMGMAN